MEIKKYELPILPYEYNALEPYIDEETMKIHHDKHHAAYVNNLNTAIEKYPDLFSKSSEDLLINLNEVPEDIKAAVRNNAGGHINHSAFWQSMSPNAGGEPKGKLGEEINKSFGNFEEFKNKFNDAGVKRFGSGWVWLVVNKEGKLDIVSTPNQDNPIMDGQKPLLGNDVWEHAYYLKYKNMRVDYLKAWWSVVNWEEVNRKFEI
ncbi:MAG: Superoxide dismutase [Parcubacteria group bacterium GW2011_GWA2_33_14]|uniref:Superoxide dismutase n=1 Tax=Candidatus Staskawiczbacteria bacterium RIFCSPHIGHO2_02_FULL_33_16 TaxID=1802204 RepID=A0A1G2HU23_9BACT|nr:MAG: Superoxide dismutase [Parcubacteria group bacterium GW2011_GWA2_33_14]OGZ65967.1 MAG: superoxide dismutase [Candidatus Staskawiczbacteria bacterium RIFCSPHIGHO2_02_FULL_33_16]OGZ70536.1 MAG: superoxide dismutase [Candidatus Staskawiczbacteria bacterium RIFCSPLOWO2_01_FULL_33_13]